MTFSMMLGRLMDEKPARIVAVPSPKTRGTSMPSHASTLGDQFFQADVTHRIGRFERAFAIAGQQRLFVDADRQASGGFEDFTVVPRLECCDWSGALGRSLRSTASSVLVMLQPCSIASASMVGMFVVAQLANAGDATRFRGGLGTHFGRRRERLGLRFGFGFVLMFRLALTGSRSSVVSFVAVSSGSSSSASCRRRRELRCRRPHRGRRTRLRPELTCGRCRLAL